MSTPPDPVRVLERGATSLLLEVTLGDRTMHVPYDPRDTGVHLLLTAPCFHEAPRERLDRTALDRVIDALWRDTHRSCGSILELCDAPPDTFVARRFRLADDAMLVRVRSLSAPMPERAGHGVVECLALHRTLLVPFAAHLPRDAHGAVTHGAPIALLHLENARWVFPDERALDDADRARVLHALTHVKESELVLTGHAWTFALAPAPT